MGAQLQFLKCNVLVQGHSMTQHKQVPINIHVAWCMKQECHIAVRPIISTQNPHRIWCTSVHFDSEEHHPMIVGKH